MPYIKQEFRELFKPKSEETPLVAGPLNFQITTLVNQYIEVNGLNYGNINDVIGALEGAKLEFYRRVAMPYEDKKIEENGDVYTVGK